MAGFEAPAFSFSSNQVVAHISCCMANYCGLVLFLGTSEIFES